MVTGSVIGTTECPFCGSRLDVRRYTLMGRAFDVPDPCDCMASIEQAAEDERRRASDARREAFARVWANSGVPEEYLHVEADASHFETLERGGGLYITGRNGRGKTWLGCQCAKHYLIRHITEEMGVTRCRRSFWFVSSMQVLSMIRSTYGRWSVSEEDVFMRLIGVDLLMLDDLGKGNPTQNAAEVFFRVISDRCAAHKATIVTSQYDTKGLVGRYPDTDAETVEAMVSRLRGRWCEGVRLTGPDRRTDG